jgi:glutathione S-transferase
MAKRIALYYSPGACSLAAHIVLYEWGVPFEARRAAIAAGETKTPAFLALNPRSRVPLLLIDDKPIRELSGILTWLGQQCGLYPAIGSYEAAKCAEWLGWMTSAVHISFALIWRGERFLHDKRLFPLARMRGYDWLREQFGEIEIALADNAYVLGQHYSVVDCNILPFYRWGNRIGFDMARDYPNWTAHTKRLLERPAVKAAIAAEDVDIWQGVDPGFTSAGLTQEDLVTFDNAWGEADIETLMRFMAPDGVYTASVGPEPGETFKGRDAVRAGFAKMLAYDGKRTRKPGELWFLGDFAFATWSFEENDPPRSVRGIDYFELSPEGITLKEGYRKSSGG